MEDSQTSPKACWIIKSLIRSSIAPSRDDLLRSSYHVIQAPLQFQHSAFETPEVYREIRRIKKPYGEPSIMSLTTELLNKKIGMAPGVGTTLKPPR